MWNPFKVNRCPHAHIRGIYGDEINHSGGYRLCCRNCGLLLDGPVTLARARTHALDGEPCVPTHPPKGTSHDRP